MVRGKSFEPSQKYYRGTRMYDEVRGTDPERSEEISLLITKTRFHLQA